MPTLRKLFYNMKVRLTVLGSGTSSGVPVIGCGCAVCLSPNPKNKRLRSSCLLQAEGKNFLIDVGPDLRQQCLTHHIAKVDAVLITHVHADHVHGIDDLRLYNSIQQASIPIYSEGKTLGLLCKTFPYIFNPNTEYRTFIPSLIPTPVGPGAFDCLGVPVVQIPCHHGERWMTYNYRIGNIAWLTDVSGIPESSYALLENLDYLFIDGLRFEPHSTHFTITQAIAEAQKINAKTTYFMHLSHDYDHDKFNKTLPKNMRLAYDGLIVTGS